MNVFSTCILIFSSLVVVMILVDLADEIIHRFRSRRKGSMTGPKSGPQRRPGRDSGPSAEASVVEKGPPSGEMSFLQGGSEKQAPGKAQDGRSPAGSGLDLANP